LPKADGILKKFDHTAIILLNGYSRGIALNDWKHHLDAGKQEPAKGWILGKDLRELLNSQYITDEEEVYLVVFRKGKITEDAIKRAEAAKVAQILESRPRSDLV
jgi:hypothetical protein